METLVKIEMGNAKTDSISVHSDLQLGQSLSPVLFNLLLEKVIKEIYIETQEGLSLHEYFVALLAHLIYVQWTYRLLFVLSRITNGPIEMRKRIT